MTLVLQFHERLWRPLEEIYIIIMTCIVFYRINMKLKGCLIIKKLAFTVSNCIIQKKDISKNLTSES